MENREITINGVVYVPKQEEHKQKTPLLNLLVAGDNDLKDVSVVANGTDLDILSAWACVSCTLLNDIGVSLSKAVKALMATKAALPNILED